LRDLNGDGFPDSIETYGENTTVAYNNAGLMGRLKRIEQPLGSDIRLSYEREGNTYNLPQNKWVLSGVEVDSGIADAPLMRQKFIYEDPNYDRYEREFLGFGGVITESIDEDGSVIRKNVDRYRNGTFFEKGLLDRRTVADSAGTVYSETTNKYVYFNVREQIWIYSPNFDSSNAFLSIAPLVESVRTVTYEPGNSGSLEQNIRYQYDRYGNVTLYEDEGGERGDLVSASVSYEYDLDNYIIANPVLIEVWNEGSLIRQRTAAFEPGKGSMIGMSEYIEGSQTTIYDFEYYPDGNLKTITFPYNYRNQRYSKTFEYENITGTYITRVSDAFGYSSTASYNYLFGLEEESFDLNGNRMKKEYDEFGRLSKVYGPYDEAIPAIDISYYTEVFPAYAVTKNKIHFDPANSETIDTSIIVDGIGRVIQTKKEGEVLIEGETTPKYGMNISGMIIFDALGRVTEEGQPVFEEGYIPSYSSGVELKRPTIKTYDILDRETLVELPDQSRISYDYLIEDGYRKTVVTDPKGNISNTYKDIRGNILKMEQYNEGEKITTRYEYNGLGEILRVEDTYGNLTEMEYDMLGRRTSLDNGDSGLLEYEYDSAGNLIYRIDPNLRERNEVIAYEYDYNRLEKTIYPDMPQVTYIYGESGAEGNRAGRLYRIDDESGWSEHSYGKLGETVRTVKSLNSLINGVEPIINETGFLFDYLGRMEEIAYTDGEVVSYGYDRGGQVTHVSGIKEGTAFNYIDAIHYDEFG
ncbi:MAG: hypothetical protein KAR21_26320, partial [Spirochaetales bacterium]|nr:hypothetical protein [Spirochaetales bacterium]